MLYHRSSKVEESGRPSTASSTREDTENVAGALGGETSMPSINAADRIAELESALAMAREELPRLKEHGITYRETFEDYHYQLASSNQQHSLPGAFYPDSRPESPRSNEEVKTPRRSFSHVRENSKDLNHDLHLKVARLEDQLKSQEAIHQSMLEHVKSHNEIEWNELISRLHATEKESQERLQQLLSLKSTISSLTRMDSQATDSELSDALSQLGNRVREWVISNFRRTRLDLSNIPQETREALKAVSLNYQDIDSGDRLALYQALVSSAMMQIFCEPVYVGLPETGVLASLRHLAAYIYESSADYRDWRRLTIRSIQKGQAQEALQEGRDRVVHDLSNEIIHLLTTLTSTKVSPEAQLSLKGILNTTAELQHTLLLQKAQYKVHFFKHQLGSEVVFEHTRMESINDLDEDFDQDGDIALDREFAFCVFPCLEKFGDESGRHAEVRNVLLKARVCCRGCL